MKTVATRSARWAAAAAALCFSLASGVALAQAKYGPGASATEIKLGQTMPYSGPASAYGTIGKVELAYFKMINDQGGINGRKIDLISLDDGYSPPKAVEQVRKLIEQDNVLALFQTLGTPSNSAIHKYVNAKKVPHLFLATGATKWGDPKHFPWTMGFNLSYQTEGEIYAKYLLKNKPNAKVAILYQNDDFGKDLLKGVQDGLGKAGAKMIIAEQTYEVTDPTIDSQILTLQASGADTFIDITTPKGRANKEALMDQAAAAVDLAEKNLIAGDGTKKVGDAMMTARDKFIKNAAQINGGNIPAAEKMADKYGLTRDKVDQLSGSIEKTPKQKLIDIKVNDGAAKTAIAGINALLNSIPDQTVYVNVKQRAVGANLAESRADGGDYFGRGGKFAGGGPVNGAGTETSDSIHALLSDNEFVMKAAARRKYGDKFMHDINSLRFASGGPVGRGSNPGQAIDYDRLAAAIGGQRPNITTTVAGGSGVDARQLAREIAWGMM